MRTPRQEGTKILLRSKQGKRKWYRRKLKKQLVKEVDAVTHFTPIRLCCGQRHHGVQCPDGLVMCCLCFERVSVERLVVDPENGKLWDVCLDCESINGGI